MRMNTRNDARAALIEMAADMIGGQASEHYKNSGGRPGPLMDMYYRNRLVQKQLMNLASELKAEVESYVGGSVTY